MRTPRFPARVVTCALLAGLLSLGLWGYLAAHLAGPPPGRTGAPGEGTCAGAGCHNGTGPGGMSIGILEYLPADTLLLGVAFHGTGGSLWGFEAGVFVYPGDTAREIVPIDLVRTQILVPPDSGRYIAHTAAGTMPVPPDTIVSWQFKAVVPPDGYADGPCPQLFVAGVAADGDATAAGDHAYTKATQLWVGSCGGCPIFLTGDINLSGTVTSADIIELIGFVFRGGQHPLPCDAAADVDCSGSVNSSDIIGMVNYVFKGGNAFCDACLSVLVWGC
jgi:hypothetical protein